MPGEFYTYQCLRSVLFAAQEVERNGAHQLELSHALMGLARELATPLPPAGPGPALPTHTLPLVEAPPLALLLLAEFDVSAEQLAQATAAAYGVILPEDLAAERPEVMLAPERSPEVERASARELLAARKAHDNHVNTRHRLLSLLIARSHLPTGRMLDVLEIAHHRDLEETVTPALDGERRTLDELMFRMTDSSPQLRQEMFGLFPQTKGVVRRRARRARRGARGDPGHRI